MHNSSNPLLKSALAGLVLASLILGARAAEAKVDPTGTWTWNYTTRDGETRTGTFELKREGDKLTGAILLRDGTEMPFRDAKLNGNEISFQNVFERDGNTFTITNRGKIEGDTIKGRTEFERDGETQSREWVAKRKSAGVTGTWQYTFTTPNGQTFEPKLKLKQEGEKVSGAILFNERERPITEGKVSNGELTLKLVRERNGQTFTSTYKGKLADNNTLKGKITSNWGGNERTYDFEAKRVKE